MFLSCTGIPQCKKSPVCQIGDFCTLMPYWPVVMVSKVRLNSGQKSQKCKTPRAQNWDKSMRASYRYGVWQTEFLVFQGADGNRVISEHKLAICWHGVKFLVQKKLKIPISEKFLKTAKLGFCSEVSVSTSCSCWSCSSIGVLCSWISNRSPWQHIDYDELRLYWAVYWLINR